MESKVKNNNYIVIPGWALNELELKGNDLIVYSIIYGFTQGESQYFTGSLQYLADWTNSTRQGVLKNLNSLLDKGLIEKIDTPTGVKYKTADVNLVNNSTEDVNLVTDNVKQSLTTVKQSLHNNIDNNIEDNIDSSNTEKSQSHVKEVVSYLNKVCGTSFRTSTKDTKTFINARFKEGFSLQDFYKVIEYKYQQWGYAPYKFSNGHLSSEYLRPSTLFGNKFESYLHEVNILLKDKEKQEEPEKEITSEIKGKILKVY